MKINWKPFSLYVALCVLLLFLVRIAGADTYPSVTTAQVSGLGSAATNATSDFAPSTVTNAAPAAITAIATAAATNAPVGGDLTGTVGNSTVAKVTNIPVTGTATSGKVLKGSGAWSDTTITSGVSHVLTASTSAGGWQLSTTNRSRVKYVVSITTASTISGSAGGSILLEICSTNSTTASDWVTMDQTGQSQALGLAVALSVTNVATSSIGSDVPIGWYMRLRTVTASGTPIYAYVTGTETLY